MTHKIPSNSTNTNDQWNPALSDSSTPKGEIKGYKKSRHVNTVLSSDKSVGRGIKTTLHKIALKVIQLSAAIKSTVNPKNAAQYQFEARLYKAVHITHTLYKMDRAWAQSVFGDQFRISTANIAQKTVLRNQADLAEAKKMGASLSNGDLGDGFLSAQPEGKEVLARIDEGKFDKITKDGICLGTSYCFIASYLAKSDYTSLEKFVDSQFKDGAPAKAGGNQAIYYLLDDHPKALQGTRLTFRSGNTLNLAEKTSHKLSDAELALAYLNGIRPVTNPSFAESLKQKVTLVNSSHATTTANQLRHPQAPFNELDSGAYEMSFDTGDGQHTTVFIKEGKKGYIFDPNYGLIDCGMEDHDQSILKLLSLYAPPTRQKGNKDYNSGNYNLKVTKFENDLPQDA